MLVNLTKTPVFRNIGSSRLLKKVPAFSEDVAAYLFGVDWEKMQKDV